MFGLDIPNNVRRTLPRPQPSRTLRRSAPCPPRRFSRGSKAPRTSDSRTPVYGEQPPDSNSNQSPRQPGPSCGTLPSDSSPCAGACARAPVPVLGPLDGSDVGIGNVRRLFEDSNYNTNNSAMIRRLSDRKRASLNNASNNNNIRRATTGTTTNKGSSSSTAPITSVDVPTLATPSRQRETRELVWACHNGYYDQVLNLLQVGGIDVDFRGEHGWTPVLHACHFGCSKIVG